jgi:guanine nucleotide-binding protein subunit beta-5
LKGDRIVTNYSKPSVLFSCNSIDVSSSGRLLFGGYSDNCLNIWDTLKCNRVATVYAHENIVTSIKLTPDGNALATASWDTNIKVN